jgi:hypothetical protein
MLVMAGMEAERGRSETARLLCSLGMFPGKPVLHVDQQGELVHTQHRVTPQRVGGDADYRGFSIRIIAGLNSFPQRNLADHLTPIVTSSQSSPLVVQTKFTPFVQLTNQ